jgi:periplasmic copper chaperone A
MYRFTPPGNGRSSVVSRIAAAGTLCALVAAMTSACSSSSASSSAGRTTAATPASSAAVASGPRGSTTVGHIKITGAYIPQPATPSVAAAYFTITETGPQGDVLLSAASVPASQASLMQESDSTGANAGTMTDLTGGLAIPADGAVALGPGGYHLMLTNPASPLTAGGSVALTLHFKDAGAVTFEVPVTSLLSDALTSSSSSTPTPTSGSGMAGMPGM